MLALFLAAALTLSGAAHATTGAATYEETAFAWSANGVSMVADPVASGGHAVKLTRNSTGTIAGPTPRVTKIGVAAKSVDCGGRPNLQVVVNGAVIANQAVLTDDYTYYEFPVNVPAGTNRLQLSFTNENVGWFFFYPICERTLLIDAVTVTTTDGVAPPPPPPPGPEYVAIGDSYSAGSGSDRIPGGPFDGSVYDGTSCYRSSKGAAPLLAHDLGLTLVYAACSGATTDNLLTTGQNNEPPQLNRLTRNTGLVTMTIGGNDTGLLGLLEGCVRAGDCWPGASPMADYYINQYAANSDALQPKVENVLRTAASKAPSARIRIAGYPNVVSAPGEPAGSCAPWLSPREQTEVVAWLNKTNDKIRQAAQAVAASTGRDIKYVDPLAADSPFMKRDVNGRMLDGCSVSNQRYMNGPNDGSASIWHPNIYGQQYYRDLYRASLR